MKPIRNKQTAGQRKTDVQRMECKLINRAMRAK